MFDTWKPKSRVRKNTPGFSSAYTGSQCDSAFGRKVRKVNVSRGSKQGNEAFLGFHERGSNKWSNISDEDVIL